VEARQQRPRGTRADAQGATDLILIKNVSVLRATYQIRLLAFMAMKEQKTLRLIVPATCWFDASLNELIQLTGCIRREAIEGV
jgi:hypothetical protein